MPADRTIEIRMVSSPDDLISAYRFIYREYIERDYIDPNPLEIRIREGFEMGWCTTTFAAFDGDEIVGTMSVIEDGDHGIPIDRHYPQAVNDARRQGDVCEISNMVVSPSARGNLKILKGLMLETWSTCVSRCILHIFIEVSPKHASYFTKAFGFEVIGPPAMAHPNDIVQGMVADASSKMIPEVLSSMMDEG